MPRLIVLLGANGSGKSSWYEKHRGTFPNFYNADEIALRVADKDGTPNLDRARQVVSQAAERHILLGEDFSFESTYSTNRRPETVRRAYEMGYNVEAIFIGTRDPKVNIDRVAFRVNVEGGHGAPEEAIRRIWFAVQENLVKTARYMTNIDIHDNSEPNEPYRPMTKISNGRIVQVTDQCEPWALTLSQNIHAEYSRWH